MKRPHAYIYITLAAFAAALYPHPATALALVAAAYLWGRWLLLWLYSMKWPLEPYRQRVEIGQYTAAYDPRRKIYHVLWKAEPTRSEFGISAAQTIHEMYASLALQPGEYLAVIQLGNERFVRYTTKTPDESRIAHIESVLRTYFVLHRDLWLSGKIKPRRWLYYAAVAPMALFLFNPAYIAAALILLYHAWNVRRWYREAELFLSLEAVSMKRDLGTSRQTLELYASAEASAIAKMQKWAVVFTPRPETAVEKEFGKAYESPVEKRGVVVKLHKTSQLLERMLKYDERPIYVQVFGSQDLATQLEIRRDPLANVLFWTPSGSFMTKALSHDLARVPIFYGGKLMSSGRKLLVGVDKFGRPVEVDIDSMPVAHAVILGPSGMGKSWTVGTLALRLAQFDDLRLVIVDPHGDYVALGKIIGAKVFRVPQQVPPLGSLENNRYFRMLLMEFGLASPAGDGTVGAKAAVEAMAKAAGVEEPEEADLAGVKHVVWDLRALKHDSTAQAFFVSLILLWYLVQQSERPFAEKVETVVIVDEAALLMHSARVTEVGVATNAVLSLIRQFSLGGRKYGLAIWLIAQLADHLPDDVIKSAGFVLQLGGTLRALERSVKVLMLDRDDVQYLISATTPRETVGGMSAIPGKKPYAMGVIELSPRQIKYHVKIPLEVAIKEAV